MRGVLVAGFVWKIVHNGTFEFSTGVITLYNSLTVSMKTVTWFNVVFQFTAESAPGYFGFDVQFDNRGLLWKQTVISICSHGGCRLIRLTEVCWRNLAPDCHRFIIFASKRTLTTHTFCRPCGFLFLSPWLSMCWFSDRCNTWLNKKLRVCSDAGQTGSDIPIGTQSWFLAYGSIFCWLIGILYDVCVFTRRVLTSASFSISTTSEGGYHSRKNSPEKWVPWAKSSKSLNTTGPIWRSINDFAGNLCL